MPLAQKTDFEVIQPPNTLKDRVSSGPLSNVDFSAVDAVIDNLSEDFINRLPEDLERIENALKALEQNPEDSARISILFRHVHDLKGQAGTFDYDLISVIGNDLCRFVERPLEWTPRRLQVVRYHVEAMKHVAKHQITGHGGEHGRNMVDTLHSMSLKILQEE